MGSSGRATPLASQPSDQNYLTWTHDPSGSIGTHLLATAGLLYVAKLRLFYSTLVTNIVMSVTTQGATLTSGQCFAALYSGAGALLSATATQHTAWESTGLKTMALTAAQTPAAGFVYAALYANGSTLPTFTRATNVQAVALNAGLAAPNLRHATADTGLTTAMPATIGTQTASGVALWVGLS